jgi:hypothetical protein
MLVAFRGDTGGNASPKGDERVRREGIGYEDGAVLQDGPVRQVQAVPS